MAAAPATDEAREREREFFDRLIADQGDFNPFTDRGWDTIRQRFIDMVAPRRDESLLDLGCGTGQSRRLYVDSVARYTGADLSPGAIATARNHFPGSEWLVADATRLPFPDGRFEIVAFSSVLHHIPDFGPALAEAFRVLKPGGRVFAFDPNLLHPAMALLRHPKSPLYISAGVSPNEKPLMPGLLRRGFTAAGFYDVRQRRQSDIPYRRVAPRKLNAALTAYNVADWVWERVGLGRLFGTFVITVGRKP